MKKSIWFLLMGLGACSSDDNTSPIPIGDTTFQFEDGFEVAGNDLQALFPDDGSRWSNVQKVNEDNQIEIEQSTVQEGNHSLRILAKATNSVLSKMGIEKGGFRAPENSTLSIEASFFIASDSDIENLLLIDLECCSCWDPTVPNNQCPGVRLMMKSDDYLSIERGKILGTTLVQTRVPFPRNEWVRIVWEMVLSPESEGQNRLLINGQEAIAESGMNMPNSTLFREEAAASGLNFELQEPLYYERFQIGATANPTESDVEIFVDDVKLEITE